MSEKKNTFLYQISICVGSDQLEEKHFTATDDNDAIVQTGTYLEKLKSPFVEQVRLVNLHRVVYDRYDATGTFIPKKSFVGQWERGFKRII